MLKYYVRRSSNEAFQQVTHPPRKDVWIHGDVVSESELQLLARDYGMDFNILRDVLDKDELPRVEMKDDGLYVFVRTANREKHGLVLTTPMLLAMKGSVFVNVSLSTTTDSKLATPDAISNFTDTEGLLLGTFAAVVNEYEILMQRTSRHIRDTGQRLRTHEVTNEDFIKFVTVEDNLNEYLMNLNGMLVVTQRLKEVLVNTEDAEAVEDILLHVRQLVVAIESHNQSIISIRNAYGTIANNVLNQRMKTLTVLTILIALPNVFYGMYGMNVALPFQDQPWAYTVILVFSVSVIAAVFAIARRRNIF
jgi:magnesium transporter